MSEVKMTPEQMEALLNQTLDNLADLPEFKPYNAGAHRCKMAVALKPVQEQLMVEVKFSHLEVLGMEDPADEVPSQGAECSALYDVMDPERQGYFKRDFAPIAEVTGAQTIKEIIEAANGMEIVLVTKKPREGTGKNEGKKFLSIFSINPV